MNLSSAGNVAHVEGRSHTLQTAIETDSADTRAGTRAHLVARSVVVLLSVALVLSVAGIVLGALDLFSVWLVVPASIVIGYGLSRWWSPAAPERSPGSTTVWWLAAAIAVASAVGSGALPSERYIGGRDASTYFATGASLADGGSLFVDVREGPYADFPDLEFGGPGFFDSRDDGRLRPQFLHGLPVFLASGQAIGGDPLMLRVNAVLGGLALLAVFGFARLLVGAWPALLVEATLAVNLVFVYFARAPFSEILAIFFIFGGLWALWDAWTAESKRTALVAGLLLGGSLLARLDSLVLLIPLVAYLAYAQRAAAGDPTRAALVRGAWRGLLPMILIAFLDLAYVTPDYLANHRRQVVPILAAVVLVVLGDAVVGGRVRRIAAGMSPRLRSGIAWFAGGALLALLAFAYFIRPVVQEVAGSPYLRLAMDPAELAAGENRLFSENSARWLGWYLGPVAVLVGFAGWAWLTKRILDGRRRKALPFLLLFSAMTLLYLWRPSINPDQIWAMRRFLPLVIPGLLVMSAYALREVWDAAAGRGRERVWRVGVGLLGVAVLGGSLLVFAPLADLHEFAGLGGDVRAGCEMMGEDAAVLLIDTPGGAAGSRLAATYRSHCGLPAAYTERDDREYLEDLQRAWAAAGRDLWLLSVDREALERLGRGDVQDVLVGEYDILELTFTRRPEAVDDFAAEVYGIRAPRT